MKVLTYLFLTSFILISCNDKASYKGHDHSSHEGHDHSSHEGHDHDSHEGHDHSSHEGHDHSSHEGHDHDSHEGHDHSSHEGHDHDSHEGHNEQISELALKNMGVKIRKMAYTNYTVFNPIPAVIAESTLSEQPLFAPYGGRIKSIDFTLGEFKTVKDILITIYRDPIERPKLKMVEEILAPASEEFHTAIASLRQNLKGKEVLQSELKRLEKFQEKAGDLSIVPQKDLIDLRYEIEKVHRMIESGRKKLELHGLSRKEITQIENGQFNIDLYRIWKNSLKSNNIWNTQADTVLKLLNEKIKKNRWTVATIGELVAEDILSKELTEWLKKDQNVGNAFLEIATLIQKGHTIKDIQNLYKLGAFNDIIQIKAPDNINGWDIEGLHVKVGQKIKAGQKLITLLDQSKMLLIAYPQASEKVDFTKAAQNDLPIAASSLTPQAGPRLVNLKISQIRGLDDGREEVRLFTENLVQSQNKVNDKTFRVWALRSGLKYILKVPVDKMNKVIVVPREAIIKHGPEHVIFVRQNKEFIRRKVHILHKDSKNAVLSPESELKINDSLVISGAFALQQALVAGTPQAVDPHAGHTH